MPPLLFPSSFSFVVVVTFNASVAFAPSAPQPAAAVVRLRDCVMSRERSWRWKSKGEESPQTTSHIYYVSAYNTAKKSQMRSRIGKTRTFKNEAEEGGGGGECRAASTNSEERRRFYLSVESAQQRRLAVYNYCFIKIGDDRTAEESTEPTIIFMINMRGRQWRGDTAAEKRCSWWRGKTTFRNLLIWSTTNER